MKKLIVVSLFILVSTSFSQLISSYGFKAGLTASKQKWVYSNIQYFAGFTTDLDYKYGFNCGVFAESSIVPLFDVVAEMNYIQKGGKDKLIKTLADSPDGSGETTTWTIHLNYLNLSLLAKPKLSVLGLNAYFLLGPSYDHNVANYSWVDGENLEGIDFLKEDLFSVKFGAGSEFNISNLKFLVEILYDYNLNHLYKNQYVDMTTHSLDFRIGMKL